MVREINLLIRATHACTRAMPACMRARGWHSATSLAACLRTRASHPPRRACGVLAYELIVGRCPFEQESRSATYESIMYR